MSENRIRSTFVTVVAWVFIVLSGFGTIAAILQNIMVHSLFSSAEATRATQAAPPGTPAFAAFMANHIPGIVLAILLLSAFAFMCSIGLLRRWNWARLGFIGLLSLAVVWELAMLGIQAFMLSSMSERISAEAAHGGPDMGPFIVAAAIVGVLFAVGTVVLFGWIIKRLVSPKVVAEFRP